MAARILDRNKATLGAPSDDLPGGIGHKAGEDACLIVIEQGLLRRRRPRPALGHGLGSGDVRFRPNTGPTVNRSSMSAPDLVFVSLAFGKLAAKLALFRLELASLRRCE